MWIDRQGLVAPAGRFDGRHMSEQIDRDPLSVTERILDRWLEPLAQVEHHVGGRDRLDLVGRQLQVVRLDPEEP